MQCNILDIFYRDKCLETDKARREREREEEGLHLFLTILCDSDQHLNFEDQELFKSTRVHGSKNKSTACGCQDSAVGCLIENEKSKSKKGNNSEKNVF